MERIQRLFLLSILLAFAAACAEEPDVEFVDEGDVCFGEGGEDRSDALEPGARADIEVEFHDCLGCSTDKHDPRCSVEKDENTLTLTSWGGYDENGFFTVGCPAVCVPYSATCETPPLEEGQYTLEHGEKTYDFEVPPEDEEESACLDEDDEQ